MSASDGIPEAWPALLSREQLRAYAGGISDTTLRKVCPLRPIDLGVNVLRYRRSEADAWLAGLPHRDDLQASEDGAQDCLTPSAPVTFKFHTGTANLAIERAKQRAGGGR